MLWIGELVHVFWERKFRSVVLKVISFKIKLVKNNYARTDILNSQKEYKLNPNLF
uniref:Uncharacterized protein n=1 Tax=Arion vulgaris TaxID=1028688 RepID=A0A0B7A0B9_9EUPU